METDQKNYGKVYLIGAGPGDPNLLTVRARTLLDKADVIAYDSLISPALLSTLKTTSSNIPIGYRGYGSSKIGYGIHPKVIEMAKQGKTVVRLKSGDPFIFGRGSQECKELLEEGIHFEVVPGISSGLAAAISAGFPLTHRDFSSSVVFTSGHDLRGGSPSHSNWKSIGESNGTIVIYMAASKVKENCQRLIHYGRNPKTPAVFIACATCGNEEVAQGTLENLGELCQSIHPKKPAIIIIGDVVKTREFFNWKAKLPLNQKQFLVVRQRAGESQMAEQLRSLGASVVEAPQFQNKPLLNSLETLLKEKKPLHLLIGQKNVFPFFIKNLIKNGYDLRDLQEVHFYVMDKSTKEELNQYGILEKYLLKGHCQKAIKEALLPKELFLVTRTGGRQSLEDDLVQKGHKVHRLEVYKREESYPETPIPEFDGIFCGSTSAVYSLKNSSWFSSLQKTTFFTMGVKTQEAALSLGLHSKMAPDDQFNSALNLIIQTFSSRKEDKRESQEIFLKDHFYERKA